MRDLLGETQEGRCLCSKKNQQRTEWEEGFIWGFLETFQGGLGLMGFCGLILGQIQELMGFQDQGLEGFCDLILDFFLSLWDGTWPPVSSGVVRVVCERGLATCMSQGAHSYLNFPFKMYSLYLQTDVCKN